MSDILLDQVKQHRKGIKHETLTFFLAAKSRGEQSEGKEAPGVGPKNNASG